MTSVIDLMTGLPIDFEVLSNYFKSVELQRINLLIQNGKLNILLSAKRTFLDLQMQWKWNVLNGYGQDLKNCTSPDTPQFRVMETAKHVMLLIL